MEKKYSISFFAAMFLCALALTIAYRTDYREAQKETEEIEVKEEKDTKEGLVPTEGDVKKEEHYYLKDLNGFIAVYLEDKKTLYEQTSIRVDELPPEVSEEIRRGMTIETLETLYSFLESYSS